MTHVYIIFNIFLPLQDTLSIGPFKFNQCTIGRITRVGANGGKAKEDEMTLGKDAVSVNVKTDKVPRYEFNGCTIREVIYQK